MHWLFISLIQINLYKLLNLNVFINQLKSLKITQDHSKDNTLKCFFNFQNWKNGTNKLSFGEI